MSLQPDQPDAVSYVYASKWTPTEASLISPPPSTVTWGYYTTGNGAHLVNIDAPSNPPEVWVSGIWNNEDEDTPELNIIGYRGILFTVKVRSPTEAHIILDAAMDKDQNPTTFKRTGSYSYLFSPLTKDTHYYD